MIITPTLLRTWSACWPDDKIVTAFAGRSHVTPREVAATESVSLDDRLWVVRRALAHLDERAARLYAIESAELVAHLAGDEDDQAQYLGLMNEMRQIEIEISDPAARAAAWDAARGAAWGTAWGAAWDAARGAAWGAAWDAARGGRPRAGVARHGGRLVRRLVAISSRGAGDARSRPGQQRGAAGGTGGCVMAVAKQLLSSARTGDGKDEHNTPPEILERVRHTYWMR